MIASMTRSAWPIARNVAAQPALRRCGRTGRLETLGEELSRPFERGLQVFLLAVLHGHADPAQGAPGCDVPAHDAGTDDMDAADGIALRREVPEPFPEQEQPDEILRGRRDEQTPDGLGLGPVGVAARCTVLLPQVDEGMRCRIVLPPGLAARLPAQAAGDERADRTEIQKTEVPGRAAWRRRPPHELERSGFGVAGRCNAVDEPGPPGLYR